MKFNIRKASPLDMGWINSKYHEIGFQYASSQDVIAIAELENGEKIGLGRLVLLDSKNLELAGIYVREPFRKKGVAKKIIEFLMTHRNSNEIVFCLPFSQVKTLYEQFGFKDCRVNESLPKAILDKCKWCEKSHKAIVDVMIFDRCHF